MTIFHIHRAASFLFAFFLLFAAVSAQTPQPLLPLTPTIRERVIARCFADNLETMHISHRPLDQAVSKEAFRLYIKSLDARKIFFYQSDIDEFKEKYELKLCELIKQQAQDLKPVFEIYNRYLDRVKERVEMAQDILAKPIDFTADEEYPIDKSKDFTLDEGTVKAKGLQSFCKTKEEAYERMRKRIKSELLFMKSAAISDAEKRERAIAEGKEPEEADQRDPVERIQKRYASLKKRMLFESQIENGEILDKVRKSANDDVMELFLNAIAGVFDPHSSYLSPSSLENFNTMMSKKLQGIGATLSSDDGYTVIKELVKGGPADKSGELRPKDKIQGVGQGKEGKIEDIVDFKLSDVVKQIRGDKGTIVRLEVLPGGKAPAKIVEIIRDEVSLEDQAAKSEIFEAGKKADGTPYTIGFIELPDFYLDMDALRRRDPNARSASSDIKKMLKEFVEKRVDVVVLDLRDNGGGSLHEAIELTGLFIESGVVVQTKDESSSRPQPRPDPDPSCDWTGPLVVLANKFSASASEIFVGAIKDYKRGLIIGDSTTHGKGTVQTVVDLSERIMPGMGSSYGAGKITIQGFYRPSGISTQRIGVDADVVLPSFSDILEDITESDLDNALTLKKVEAALNAVPKTAYITPQVISDLQKRANERIKENGDFKKLQDKITSYKEIRARKATPLNEVKYLEESRRFNVDEWEREELEAMLGKDKKIKRDFYVNEALAITVDYLKITQETGIAFPKDRSTSQSRRTWFGFGL